MLNHIKHILVLAVVINMALLNAGAALCQTTAFTFQGRLTDNSNPASGFYDITFKLFDTATVGSGIQQGATLNRTGVEVTNGTFSVQLDFGACANCFNGTARYLEIGIKPAGGSTFTTLEPRQALTASPYAIKSLSAATADGLSVTCVSCVTSSQIASVNGSVVNGAIPVASVPAGSGNYIQNSTLIQPSSNFNITGDGTIGGNGVIFGKLQIGTPVPSPYTLLAKGFGDRGLRVETRSTGGAVASFGGFGNFEIDAQGVVSGR